MSGSDEVLAITTNENDNANQLNENNTFNTVNHEEIIVENDEWLLDSNSNMKNNNESQYDHYQSSVLLQTPVNTISNLSDNVITSINGVKFIDAHEMTFVQARCANHPDIAWNAHYNLTPVRPSPKWFSDDYPWLRAVYSDNYHGLICVDCAEFASSNIAIKKNNGPFVVRPYWKL